MMSYARGSSVGTTSTSVPECRKKTPDRLAVCTVEDSHARVAWNIVRENNQHKAHNPKQPQGPQPGGAEPHGQDRQNHRDHGGGGGGGGGGGRITNTT